MDDVEWVMRPDKCVQRKQRDANRARVAVGVGLRLRVAINGGHCMRVRAHDDADN